MCTHSNEVPLIIWIDKHPNLDLYYLPLGRDFSFWYRSFVFLHNFKMAKNHAYSKKIKFLSTLSFLQLLKLKKEKCAQIFDFLTKNVSFGHFVFSLKNP